MKKQWIFETNRLDRRLDDVIGAAKFDDHKNDHNSTGFLNLKKPMVCCFLSNCFLTINEFSKKRPSYGAGSIFGWFFGNNRTETEPHLVFLFRF